MGLGYYNTDMDALDGIAQMEDDNALMGIAGLGQEIVVAGQGNLMKSIIANNTAMQRAVRTANAEKVSAASSNPLVASKLRADAKRKSIPNTNVQSQVIRANQKAAAEAKKALLRKQQAAKALRAGDKQKAAAATISFMQHNREATTLAMRAEKTRMALAADRVAAMLEEQARVLEMGVRKKMAVTGSTPSTNRGLAQVAAIRQKAKRLRALSASVATLSDTPSSAPTPRRVAELANKYNIRTAMRNQMDDQRALISVLSDISGNMGLAQADDYAGAVEYYGNDLAGNLMADIEYSNVSKFLQGLNAMDSLGQQRELEAKAAAAEKELDSRAGPLTSKSATAPVVSQGSGSGSGSSGGDAAASIMSGIMTFRAANQAVQEGIKTGKQITNEVASTARMVGIKVPQQARPPVVVSKPRINLSTYKSAMRPPPVTTTQRFMPQKSNMMLYGGIAVVAVAAVFVVPKLMKKPAAA